MFSTHLDILFEPEQGMGTLEASDNAIVLLDAPVDADVVISLPHSDASRYHTMVGVVFHQI